MVVAEAVLAVPAVLVVVAVARTAAEATARRCTVVAVAVSVRQAVGSCLVAVAGIAVGSVVAEVAAATSTRTEPSVSRLYDHYYDRARPGGLQHLGDLQLGRRSKMGG